MIQRIGRSKILLLLFFIPTLSLRPLLVTAQSAIISGHVQDQFGNLPGAKIVLEGKTISTPTDVNGDFTLKVPSGKYDIRASFVMYVDQVKSVELLDGDSVFVDFDLQYGFLIDQEISIGSRSKPRSLLETTVPVEIVSPQDISNSPFSRLSEILHYLIPSFHSTSQTIADGTDHVDPSSLRGLGPDQVLILVNGKRRHSSSLLNVNGTVGRGTVGTDLNAIPVAAVDRIEILRDGAAAQYGSDAIAGVINIILKDQTSLTSVDSGYGLSTEGDGEVVYTSTNFGFKIGESGYMNLTAQYLNRGSVNRSGNYTGTVYSDDEQSDQALVASNDFFSKTGYSGQRTMEIGQAASQDLSFFFNAELPLTNSALFYAHGGSNFREGNARGFYRFPKEAEKVVLELYPDGFSPEIETAISDKSLTLGFKGLKNAWLLDFSHSYGANDFDINVHNSNNASLGTASPNTFYAGGFKYQLNITNFDISRTINKLKGINFAFGTELRLENYQILDGEESSWVNGGDTLVTDAGSIARTAGAQVFPGFQPENALNKNRTNFSMYTDIEANITEKLLLGLAGRYENYNDFAGRGTWKISARYKVNKRLSMNGGYATGFRAPSLHQVYFNNISTQFVNGEALQVGTFNNQSSVAAALDIGTLNPELSEHVSTSLTARLHDQLTLTLGLYSVMIKDRIVLSGRFGEGYEGLLEPLGISAAQFFTNAIDTQTSGMDGKVNFNTKLGKGNLRSSVAMHLTQTRLVGHIRTPDLLDGQEETLFNREEVSRLESAQPNYKMIFIVGYKYGKVHFETNNTLFGQVEYVHPDDGNELNWVQNDFTGELESRDQTFNSKLVTNVKISCQVSNHINISLGGNNIFDIYPDEHTHSDNIDHGLFIYSRRVQQFGVKGANYYARLLIKL